MDRTLKRGDSLVFSFQAVVDPVTGVISTCVPNQIPGGLVPYNLTGHHVYVTVKLYPTDADSSAVWQLDNQALAGVTIPTPINGIGYVLGAAFNTRQFPDGDVVMVYDIEDISASGVVTTIEDGTITLSFDVTRATS